MENLVLQTTQPGNTSESLLAVLLLMQAVHRCSDSITKIWHFGERAERPMGDVSRTFGYLVLELSIHMAAALMLDFLPALQWVGHLPDGRPVLCRMLFGHQKKHPNSVRIFWMREGSECFLYYIGISGCELIGLCTSTYQQESVETRVKKWSVFSSNRQSRGWRLRPFPGELLCPLNIPRITIVHGIGCSLASRQPHALSRTHHSDVRLAAEASE